MTLDRNRYRYRADYIPDVAVFRSAVRARTVRPHQVEFHPAPTSKSLCWLRCPHCYGASIASDGERMSGERMSEVLDEVLDGGVRKVLFAGVATDPLNADTEWLGQMLMRTAQQGAVLGINTKMLRRLPQLLQGTLLSVPVVPGSWITVSVDAGSSEAYNAVHGLPPKFEGYWRVRENMQWLAEHCGDRIELSATYLVMGANAKASEIVQFIRDFRSAGCQVLRFAFPQEPRKHSAKALGFLGAEDRAVLVHRLREIAASWETPQCQILVEDTDRERDLEGHARTLPCVARFIFPTVGFDGRLYPCSQTAAPCFHPLALGNLATRGFWDLYREYDTCSSFAAGYEAVGCRCDRKAHLVNRRAQEMGGGPAEITEGGCPG